MQPPSHPESDDPVPHHQPSTTSSRANLAAIIVIGALVAALVILHLTGVVGPAAR